MTAKDRFTRKLKCPQCGRTGDVHFVELDGAAYLRNQTTTVTSLSDGFKKVDQASNVGAVDILCEKCNVSALP